MTVIAILFAFTLCHIVRELSQVRNHQWLEGWIDLAGERFSRLPGWTDITGYLVILLVPLAALGLLNHLVIAGLGNLGAFVLAVAVLIYTFGQRDLDLQVDEIIRLPDGPAQEEALRALFRGDVPADPQACREKSVDAIFSEALHRWFGIIFWFALLGVVGALLYRMVDWLVAEQSSLSGQQKALFVRTRHIIDWPAAQLMTLSLAIATDFDSVFTAWKAYHGEQGHSLFDGENGFLLASARQVVLSGHAARDGYADQLDGHLATLKQAMDLTWRLLGVVLTVLAILLLIDVIT